MLVNKSFIIGLVIVLASAAGGSHVLSESLQKDEVLSAKASVPTEAPTVTLGPTIIIQSTSNPVTEKYPQINNTEDSNDSESPKNLKYNPYSKKWEYATDDERLYYNAVEDTWEYASDDEITKYNAMEGKWEIVKEDEELKYNPNEDTWKYASSNSINKYNTMENKWETTSPDSVLKYNAMENTWSYE